MRIIVLVIFLFTCEITIAQTASIEVIGRIEGDTVTLRWAPTSAIAWQLGNKHGYRVYRYALRNTGDSLTTERQLVAMGLKPLPLEEWKPLVERDDYAAIAAQALYGKEFKVSNPGANTMEFIDQVKEQESRFGFSLHAADLSVIVANAMGLRIKDRIPDRSIRWGYRVELMQNPTDYTVNSGSVLIDPQENYSLAPPKEVKADFGDRSVQISWTSLYDYGVYVAYNIERSVDGGKTYQVRNQAPIAIVSKENRHRRRTYYYDSLEANYKLYHYRIRGLTPFGDFGPPSEGVFGTGLGSVKGLVASIDSSSITEDGSGYIHWQFPEDQKHKLLGYKVGKASTAAGPFTDISQIINTSSNEYLDRYLDPVNYYVVKAIGRDSAITESMPIMIQPVDSFPPSTPVGLTGKVDTTGIVYLDWKPNKEPDLSGYRVYRANSIQEEFVQVTVEPLEFSDFRDKIPLETLTEDIFYKIIAVDRHDNPSEYSPPIKLKRPDKVPPAAPVFTTWRSDNSGIYLEWIGSSSDDVVMHKIERIDNNGHRVELQISQNQTNFKDKQVIAGNRYIYTLKAVDDAGIESIAAILEIEAFNDGIRPVISDVKGAADRDNRRVVISWKYPHDDVKRYLIYRQKGEEPLRLLKSVDGDTKAYADRNVNVSNSYIYRLKAIFNNDDESELSEEVEVRY